MIERKPMELIRKELYDLLWSRPTRDVAGEIGMSDAGLAKLCKREKIPKPGRGYWAIVESGGKLPKQPKLPEFGNPEKNLSFFGKEPEQELFPESIQLLARLQRLPFATSLDIPVHRRSRLAHVLDLNVSPGLVDRGQSIYHLLIQNFEPAGITFRRAQQYVNGPDLITEAVVQGVGIHFKIDEVLTYPRKNGNVVRKGTCIPTGKLRVQILPGCYSARLWQDQQELSIEEQQKQIAEATIRAADYNLHRPAFQKSPIGCPRCLQNTDE